MEAKFSTFQCMGDYSSEIRRASDLLVSVSAHADVNKARIVDLAFAASEELRVMAQEREPLWLFDIDRGTEVLNVAEYNRRFASLDPTLEEVIRVIKGGASELPNLTDKPENGCTASCTTENKESEASRAIGVVLRNPISLVNMFMDVHTWSASFSNIISKATSLAVLTAANQENPDGALQVIVAQFHVPSPLIKAHEMYFARYARQIDTNAWLVADVSLEAIFPSPMVTCQRKPSGCIIQALQDGFSTITWVEHNADCNSMEMYKHRWLPQPGVVFSAKRWISSLERQCDIMATLEGLNDSLHYLSINRNGIEVTRSGLLKLSDRMFRFFNFNTSSNAESAWRPLPIPGAEEILIKTSLNQKDPGIPRGAALTIATSIGLPVNQNNVFYFLQTPDNRNKWDILSHGQENLDVIRISSARNSIDCVSVVSAKTSSTSTSITYLQESFSDSTSYYVVYAPVDIPTMQHILQGGCTEEVAILPSGFAVLPGGSSTENSILTVQFQILDEQPKPQAELPVQSVLTAYKLMKETVSRIWTALQPKMTGGF